MRKATWMKSAVRETSCALGLKTRRPPATILIPGRRGVARSRRSGKSRIIGEEERSSARGQVDLGGEPIKENFARGNKSTCRWLELISQRQGTPPKQWTPRQM